MPRGVQEQAEEVREEPSGGREQPGAVRGGPQPQYSMWTTYRLTSQGATKRLTLRGITLSDALQRQL